MHQLGLETPSGLGQSRHVNISEQLGEWYLKNQRKLPWRESRDPYKIWISEVMLQQTTVRVVIPYYERFLRRFPNVSALGRAPEEDVLSLWSGLGYYSRARNLHRAARNIIEGGGRFPEKYEDLLKLPGFGPYTAAAVASIAFGEQVPVLDGNVSRVLSRLFDIPAEINSRKGKKTLLEKANLLIAGQPPQIHNQAMMELGALICSPTMPACIACPASDRCESLKNGTVAARPVKKTLRKKEDWLWTLHLCESAGRIAFVQTGNGTPWLKNTWVLPGRAQRWDKPKRPHFDFQHTITHHKIYVRVERKLKVRHRNLKWVRTSEIDTIGVSSVVMKALKHLENIE